MMEGRGNTATTWSRRKKDDLPRGLFRHRAGGFGVRYVCSAGHVRQEHAGTATAPASVPQNFDFTSTSGERDLDGASSREREPRTSA
jgi:hypothetical protein